MRHGRAAAARPHGRRPPSDPATDGS